MKCGTHLVPTRHQISITHHNGGMEHRGSERTMAQSLQTCHKCCRILANLRVFATICSCVRQSRGVTELRTGRCNESRWTRKSGFYHYRSGSAASGQRLFSRVATNAISAKPLFVSRLAFRAGETAIGANGHSCSFEELGIWEQVEHTTPGP